MVQKTIIYLSISAIVIGSIFVVNGLILAHTAPTADPPGDNVPAPLNVGSDTQTKSGELNISGKVGIGGDLTLGNNKTIYGTNRMHVYGSELLYLLNANGVIIGKEWGGSGDLSIQGKLTVDGNITAAGQDVCREDGTNCPAAAGESDDLWTVTHRGNITDETIIINSPGSLQVWGELRDIGNSNYYLDMDVNGRIKALGIDNGLNVGGNVGIGTASPDGKLHITDDFFFENGSPEMIFETASTHYNWRVAMQEAVDKGFEIASGNVDADATNDTWTNRLVIKADTGNVGIGTTNPRNDIGWPGALDVNGQVRAARYYDDDTSYYIDINTTSYFNNANFAGNVGIGGKLSTGSTGHSYLPSGGNWDYNLLLHGSDYTSIGFHDSGHSVGSIRYYARNFYIGYDDGWGVANVNIGGNLNVGGSVYSAGGYSGAGCDIAELYEPSQDNEELEPGDIVVLDEEHEKKIKKSSQSYSTLVIGVVSTNPSMTMGVLEDNEGHPPVALLGRVPTKVTAENGPIKIGDLVVSSSKPGYGMKCDDYDKCQGAVVGKATENLESGEGLIEVLIKGGF